MKPIRFYFAGIGGIGEEELVELGVRNRLISYAYPAQLKELLSLPFDVAGHIILDSGAFSVWNKGEQVDLNDYIQYAHKAIEAISAFKNRKMHVVNLDVIPGHVKKTSHLNRVRKREHLELIEAAAHQGYKNMRRMIGEGIRPIHVFHQGEAFSWIDRMVEHISYIGIAPGNDLPIAIRYRWISTVFEYLYKKGINVDTHGFGISYQPLRDFPWTSCDSTAWRILAAMGRINYPKGGFSTPDYSCFSTQLRVSAWKVGKDALQPLLLKKLEKDGYSYDDLQTWRVRAHINIRYALGLEKWLNEYKTKNEYKPHTSLGLDLKGED
jgi:hypothetical protein